MAEFSAPIAKRKFTADEWRYVIGNEPGIKEDNDGTAYDLTFSTGSDEALIGSLTQDSRTVVGGAVHWVPTGQRHPVTIPPATSAPRTDLIVVRNDPAWGALPTDPTAAAAWVGPCRLYRIPGTEGSGTAPAYDGDPTGIEDEVLWEVTRKPGESLAQATRKDRRIRTGPNLSAATRADLPNVAPLGSRATVGVHQYVRTLDDQGAPFWYRLGPRTAGTWEARTGVSGGEVTVKFDEPFLTGTVPSVTVQDSNVGDGLGMIFWKTRAESATGFIARAMPASGASPVTNLPALFHFTATA